MADFTTTNKTPTDPEAPSLVKVPYYYAPGLDFTAGMMLGVVPRTPRVGLPRPTLGLVFPRGRA